MKEVLGRFFLKPFFSHSRKPFSKFPNILCDKISFYVISLAYKISCCLLTNHILLCLSLAALLVTRDAQ